MTRAEEYLFKAAQLSALAEEEGNPTLSSGFQQLAEGCLRVAEQLSETAKNNFIAVGAPSDVVDGLAGAGITILLHGANGLATIPSRTRYILSHEDERSESRIASKIEASAIVPFPFPFPRSPGDIGGGFIFPYSGRVAREESGRFRKTTNITSTCVMPNIVWKWTNSNGGEILRHSTGYGGGMAEACGCCSPSNIKINLGVPAGK